MDAFAHPALLPLGPLAVLVLWLLERWRQRPVRLVVADVGLFETTPEVEAAARARRRRLGLRFLLLALAALALGLAAAGPRGPRPAAGPLVVDLVLDRGVTSGVIEEDGASRLEHHRRHLRRALDALGPDDRARVHLVPGEPGATPLAPAAARALLDAAAPTAAAADLGPALARLAPQGRPLLVATDQEVPAAALVAVSGAPRPDRGIVALARGDDGALHATVASHDAPGPVRVRFAALDAQGREAEGTVDVDLPIRGLARASWTGLPPDAVSASAALEGQDALAANDRAFAVAAPPRRRVAVVGEPGPAVRRALLAVPGTTVTDLPQAALDAVPRAGEAFDLVVAPALPAVPPRTALAIVPAALPRVGRLPGGPAGPRAHAAFPFTLAEVAAAPFAVEGLGPLDPALGRPTPLLVVGDAPLVAVRGAGRELVVALAAPVDATAWPRHDAFPLFWGELLALAAPRGAGALEAHPAGLPWIGPQGEALAPLHVGVIDDPDGRPLLGTVAAPARALAALAAARAFTDDLAARLDAARRPGAPRPLAPPLAGLGLLLLGAGWWLERREEASTASPRLARTTG
ncbi:MAG: BatA domain-containing protein [Planctomycetes bacterium]|nr:BatA domain-containing protein [Planctomycetota bacterium]